MTIDGAGVCAVPESVVISIGRGDLVNIIHQNRCALIHYRDAYLLAIAPNAFRGYQ